jgi:ATP-binding cassette, sub-family E, member 1
LFPHRTKKKHCPFDAIKIINLPEEKPENIVHRYSINGFRLYKLPILKQNKVIGIVGENGVGKSTIIDILCNNIKPNFEMFHVNLTHQDILKKFKGNVLQNYFKDLYQDRLIFSIKEQNIKKQIPKTNMNVKDFLHLKQIDIDCLPESYYVLGIDKLMEIQLQKLSGGELQRLLCWITANTNANVYIFDEPSNFLDIKQRLEISKLIKSLQSEGKYVIVIDHDLSILDYISDELFIVYGNPGAYGIVSRPLTTSEGINMYLDGYISTENIRFREEEFRFKPTYEICSEDSVGGGKNEFISSWSYSSHPVEYTNYKLTIPEGTIQLQNSICVILGENSTGKTTFINWLSETCGLKVSIKEQNVNIRKYMNTDGSFPTVLELLHNKIRENYVNPTFQTDIIRNLEIEQILTRRIDELSGGEFQRIQIVLCLGHSADIYFLDEPSANLDIEKD